MSADEPADDAAAPAEPRERVRAAATAAAQADASAVPPPVGVVVDDRERRGGLVVALAQAAAEHGVGVSVGRLVLGDIEVGPRVLVERKTVRDFVASLADGRLFDQAAALARTAERPLLIVEGDDGAPLAEVAPRALRGTLLALVVGLRVPLLRTDDADETARTLVQVALQETRRLARFGRATDERARRVRRARESVSLLGAIPGVGDMRARRLLDAFGAPRDVLAATEDELRGVRGVGPATARAVAAAGDGAEPPSREVSDRPRTLPPEDGRWRRD